jgi:hypothetical protein
MSFKRENGCQNSQLLKTKLCNDDMERYGEIALMKKLYYIFRQKANYNWTWTSIIGENKANDFCSDHIQSKVCPKYESMTLGSKSYFGTGTLNLILALEDLEAVMVVGFTSTYAFSAYHYYHCEFESRS